MTALHGFAPSEPAAAALLGFVMAAAVTGCLWLGLGPRRGAAAAGTGLVLGFLAAWLYLAGLPPWPPQRPLSMVPAVAVFGAVIGAACDGARLGRGPRRAMAAVFALAASWSLLGRPDAWSPRLCVEAACLLAGWAVVLGRLDRHATPAATRPVVLAAAALGLAAVAAVSDLGVVAARVAPLAAATAATWGWAIGFGVPFGSAAVLGGGGALVALATTAGLSGRVSPWALALLAMILFADTTAADLARSLPWRRGAQTVALALLCLLPAGLAVAVGYVAARG